MFTQKAGVPFMIALQIRVKGECIFYKRIIIVMSVINKRNRR